MPALPFCHVRLKGQKPKSLKYPKELKTVGDHIRKRRLELALLQREVARRISTTTTTISRWETNETSPQVHHLPKIVWFLGYNPLPASKALPGRLLMARELLGVTQRVMAKRLGIDPTTLARWENGKSCPSKKLRAVIEHLLGSR
jgi:transcriptional regulator with XRE-family HTH domain